MVARIRRTVRLARRVEVSAGAGRAGPAAITLLVHVETMAARRETGDMRHDGKLVFLLGERHRTLGRVALGRRNRRGRDLRLRGPCKTCCQQAPGQRAHLPAGHRALLAFLSTATSTAPMPRGTSRA